MGVVRAAHVSSTHDSDNMSSAADVLGMSVVRGMIAVVGVYHMCMCLARGCVGGKGDEWIGFGLYQSSGNSGGVGRVCVAVVWVV